MELGQGRVRLGDRKKFFNERLSGTGTALQDSGCGTKPARDQGMFEQCCQTPRLILGWSCVEPGVVLDDPCGFLPTWDIQ